MQASSSAPLVIRLHLVIKIPSLFAMQTLTCVSLITSNLRCFQSIILVIASIKKDGGSAEAPPSVYTTRKDSELTFPTY